MVDGSALHVVVDDDGVWVDPQVHHSGFCLGGMREGVALLRGELEITSSTHGTRVAAVVPTG